MSSARERCSLRCMVLAGAALAMAVLGAALPAWADGGDFTSSGCCAPEIDETPPFACAAAPCRACACSHDPICCEGPWTGACAELANTAPCSASCGCSVSPETLPPEPCCSPSGGTGCGDADCELCVCQGDPLCCEVAWDASCADAALGECWESCTCATAPIGPLACTFPNECVGAAVPSTNGCQPLQVGASSFGQGCNVGVVWDLVACNTGLPPTADVVFVDDSAPGPGSGTQVDPFPTISQGVAAAAAGDTVCIGTGVYPETPIVNKPLRLIGACPTTTRIQGGTLRIVGTNGVQVHSLGVRGGIQGGISIVASLFTVIRNCELSRNRPANILVHNALTGGAPGLEPSPCGCGAVRNVDVCDSTLRGALNGGAGFRAKHADDVRLLRLDVRSNGGPGIFTEDDAILIAGSRIKGNRVGVVLKNPRETVLVQNNTVEANLQGGVLGLRNDGMSPAITFRVESNAIFRNGGWGAAVNDVSGATPALYGVVQHNTVDLNRRAGILAAGIRVDLLDNDVSQTKAAAGLDAMTSGRGLEVLAPRHLSRVRLNTVTLGVSGGILFVTPDASAAVGTEVFSLEDNAVDANGWYGIAVSSTHPLAPAPLACPSPAGVAACPSLAVGSNQAGGNGGAAFYAQNAQVEMALAFNDFADSSALTQPVGTFAYSAVLDGSKFSFASNTSTFAQGPTAHVLVAAAAAGSSIGANAYTSPPGAPEVALNSGQASSLGIPPGVVVIENAALPMPCPLIPLDAAVEASLIDSL